MVLGAPLAIAGLPAAYAETPALPQAVNLAQLANILKEYSPRLAAERTRIDIAQAELVAAEALPNPTVSYGRYDLVGGVNTLFNGSQQQQTTVGIPVLIAGQRPARREAARRGVTTAEAQTLNVYAGLLKDTWQLFVQLLGAQEKRNNLEEAAAELNRLQGIVEGRERSGAASRYDVVRIEVEAADLRARTGQARAETADLSGRIGVALGLPHWKPQAVGSLQPVGVAVDLATLMRQTESANPAVIATRRQEEAAEANIEKARRERWPTPVINLGNAWTNNPYGMVFFAGLSVEIPLFDRGQGPIARAQAEKWAASQERQALLSATQAELERAAELLMKNRNTLARFEQDVAGRLPELKLMAENAYRLGKGSLLELLDAARSRSELALRRVDLTEAVVVAEIDTLAAAGLLDAATAEADSKAH
jgi:cobalt-zinc-cadmium efflux system outer membrane protein